MSSLETNKIVGAVLLAAMVAMATGFVADLLLPSEGEHAPAEQAPAEQATAESTAATAEPPAPVEDIPIATLLASADPAAGAAIAKKCATCHSFGKGEAAKVGPNLWGVVGSNPGQMAGFAYSPAVTGLGVPWDYENLNTFLTSPKAYAPGTKMTFAGLKKAEDRAAVVAYLRTLSDTPLALPEAAPAEVVAPAETTAETAEATTEAPTETATEAATTTETAGATTETEAVAPATDTPATDTPATDTGLAALLAAADPAAGEKVAKKCAACHSFDQGGAARVGPNLWGIVGNKPAHMEGFSYSPAISGLTQPWDYATLDTFLTSPKAYAPGTKMTFPGLKKPEDRAAVIIWLRTLSDQPVPLP
jgi:cytochrome c